MDKERSGMDFWGIIDVVAGQYLLYLAYQTYINRGEYPSEALAWGAAALFVVGGAGAIIWGVRRIIQAYRAYKEANAPGQEDEGQKKE